MGRVERVPLLRWETAADRQHDATGDRYTDLPWEGPHTPVVGHALITMVEPHLGHEHAYNRWYEDSHFFSAALQHPWVFAGRRWVAPYELQQLRYPQDSPVARPVTAGTYLGTYWMTHGRLDDLKRWSAGSEKFLTSRGHVNRDRTHVFTSFQDKAGTVYASDDVPRDVHSLMDPAPGLVLQTVDAPDTAGRDALEDWLLDEYLPTRVTADSPASSAMVFRVNPAHEGMKPEVYAALKHVANEGRRLTVLWFLTQDPRDCWDYFTGEIEHVHAGGAGETTLVAPFIPAKMGTTRYENELREP